MNLIRRARVCVILALPSLLTSFGLTEKASSSETVELLFPIVAAGDMPIAVADLTVLDGGGR